METTEEVPMTEEIEIVGHSYGTSSFINYMERIERIGSATGNYNPDLPPCQNPVLRQFIVDIQSAEFREALYEHSIFLSKQTSELIRGIFEQGWIASDGRELPEFDAKLREKAIECASIAQIVNSAYLMKFQLADEVKWDVMSSNYIYRRFGNTLRNITEVYFQYPSNELLFSEIDGANFATEIIGFLTQHTQDKKRPNRFLQSLPKNMTTSGDVIERQCVQCLPQSHVAYPDGFPFLIKESQTALEKIYLRFYEMMYIHKGGINKTLVIPDGIKSDVKKKIIKEYKRGMMSLGGVISVNNVKVNETFLAVETQIPDLHLDVINSHLSEDSKVSKQKIEGEAASGALGGVAPKVNKEEDDDTIIRLKPVLSQFLKDIYDVFFNIPSHDYEIEFKEEDDEIVEINDTDATQDENIAHSINDDYVTYNATMLPAGVYNYPERGVKVFYSRNDVRRMCQRSVNKFYLEIDHSYKPELVDITEGVGYGEIIGFDEVNGGDITKLYVKRAIANQIGKKIKISPYMNKVQLSDKKLLSIRNCAILKNSQPRAELTGLKSEATRESD